MWSIPYSHLNIVNFLPKNILNVHLDENKKVIIWLSMLHVKDHRFKTDRWNMYLWHHCCMYFFVAYSPYCRYKSLRQIVYISIKENIDSINSLFLIDNFLTVAIFLGQALSEGLYIGSKITNKISILASSPQENIPKEF